MRINSGLIHVSQALLEGALVAALIVMLAVGTTFAAKGGNSKPSGGGTSGSSLSVRMVIDNNGDGSPNWNDWITFNVTTSASQPWVKVDCFRDGAWIYTASAGFYSTYAWNPYFDLASTGWSSGAASCTATLYVYSHSGKVSNLTKMAFDVAA